MKFTQILKWVGICDGVIAAGATALARTYPPAASYVDTVIEVAGTLTTMLGAYGHLTAGTNAGPNFVTPTPAVKP